METIEHEPRLPFRMVLAGCSSSGKSTFATSLLLNWNTIWPGQPIRKLVVVYSYFQPLYCQLQEKYGDKCIFTTSLTADLLEKLGEPELGPACILLDDVAHKIGSSDVLVSLYIGACHHLNICCMLVTQNLFASRHSNWITAMRNANYILIFHMPRDASSIQVLGRQIWPHKNGSLALAEAYNLALHDYPNEYGYLLIDCTPHCPNQHRLRVGLLPTEKRMVYSVIN